MSWIEISLILFAILLVGIFLVFLGARSPARDRKYFSQQEIDQGEREVSIVLGETIEGKQYIVNDIIIEEKGKTSQIDHVFINEYGVWVIETKSWSGQVYGEKEEQFWSQELGYDSIITHQHYNPIKQNQTHIYFLRRVFGADAPLFNIVVFTRADIDELIAEEVCSIDELNSRVWTDTGKRLNAVQMYRYYTRLIKMKEENAELKNKHIENIKTKYM